MDPKKQPQKAGGYGKLSKKQWWLIYIVAAVIVYGIIYLLFIRNSAAY
ncbi:MAG TPA: hypothetical protein VJJ78_02810 [Candidatus Saccharimonadales bacterium]|nr:hypothetical protein [Candidatus Saccharimonadales bacterium]